MRHFLKFLPVIVFFGVFSASNFSLAAPATTDLQEEQIKKNKENAYLKAAKEAKEELGNNQWHGFLKEQLNIGYDLCDEKSLTTAQAVWQLGSPLIITTNYDKVLSWSCPKKMA